MLGNTLEWCFNHYSDYPKNLTESAPDLPEGLSASVKTPQPVQRGGAYILIQNTFVPLGVIMPRQSMGISTSAFVRPELIRDGKTIDVL